MNDHEHNHDHEHDYKGLTVNRLRWSLGITLAAMAVEAVGGWLFGSIALVSDAGHMLTHGFALAVALAGILIARLPVCHHRTFGLLRAEVLAALLNALFLLALTVWIFVESIERLRNPQEIMTLEMLGVAILGLVVNLVSIFLLEGSRDCHPLHGMDLARPDDRHGHRAADRRVGRRPNERIAEGSARNGSEGPERA